MRRLPEAPTRIFPDRTLLNHTPDLVAAIGGAVASGDPSLPQELVVDLGKLANLRRAQGYGTGELLSELDLLCAEVLRAVGEECAGLEGDPAPEQVLRLVDRVRACCHTATVVTLEEFNRGRTSDLLERSLLLSSAGRALSHELRNRLNAVALTARLLTDEISSLTERPGIRDQVRRLDERIRRVERVVDDVFAVAIAHGRADPVGQTVSPFAELVEALFDDVSSFAAQRGVELRLASDVPTFMVDATRVQLALLNLVGNAIKYSDPEKSTRYVLLSVAPPAEERRGGAREGFEVRVEDNGVGVAEGDRDRIFERNQRGSDVGEIDGSGLGLSLAREAISQLGGRLWLEETSVGACFAFSVPSCGEVPEPQSSLP